MAPVGEKSDRDPFLGDTADEEDSQNLWDEVLGDVQSSSSQKLPTGKNILVLGENESGKTTLIARLQGNEDPKKGTGLEYCYIDIKDEYRDDQTHLGAWILDGDPHHTGLMKFALTEENFADSVVLLVASMAQPWNIMETLQRWTNAVSDHIDCLRIPRDQQREYQDSLVRHFQEYTDPEENSQMTTSRRGGLNPLHPTASKTDEERVLLPLGETTLTHNLGVPIVVVVSKSDAISTLEKEHDYREEHFDFIQQHIRKFCLNYGAALFYTSVKEDKNCDLLLKYLQHRIYGFPFSHQAYVVERDSVFIPSGWDNEKKISILYENMTSMKPDDSYEDVIARPITRKTIQRDAELTAEDEQVFLMKQQTQLSKAPAAASPSQSPLRPSSGVQKPSTSPRVGATTAAGAALAGASPKKLEGGKPGAGASEGVLANFFNSLLSKKTGAAGAPGTPGGTPKGSENGNLELSQEIAVPSGVEQSEQQ